MRARTALLWQWLLAGPCLQPSSIAHGAPQHAQGPVLDPGDDRIQRKAIRGGPVDSTVESEELRELREFEESAFPRAGVPHGEREREPALRDLYPGARDGTSTSEREGLQEAIKTPIPWLSALKLFDHMGLGAGFVRLEAHVIKYLEFYKEEKRGRSIMTSWLRKQGRYRDLIEEVLQRHKLPRFLLYVAMIESGYDPHDRSTAGAVGLWQFLPEGARIYGLRVDYWVDERKEPARATEAAARYLGDLKARFGSWHLALAAFNAGYGAVLRAMQKYNTNDYWELCRHEDGLPWETLLYVPKAIATALVGENRALFGYEGVIPDPPVGYDRVEVRSSVSLADAARAAGVTLEEVQALNPELRRGRTPPLAEGGRYSLKLPRGSGPKFYAAYDPRKEEFLTHVLRFGETLEDIARARGVSVRELKRINGVEERAELRAGVTLLVPPQRQATPPAPPEEITVVAVPDKDLVVPGRKQVFYRVVPGDTLSAIAQFFRVSQSDLGRWNHLDLDATLAQKMVLRIFVDKGFDTSQAALLDPARVRVVKTGSDEFFELIETLRGRKRLIHLCRAGDTLHKIAKRYGLTVADLERINRLSKTSEIKPGQPITVYVAMSEKEKMEAQRRLLRDGEGQKPAQVTATPIHDAEEEDEAQVSERREERRQEQRKRDDKKEKEIPQNEVQAAPVEAEPAGAAPPALPRLPEAPVTTLE